MSPNEEAENANDDQPNYERPPAIIGNRAKTTEQADADKQQAYAASKANDRLKAVKKWCARHATPMNFLTLVIAAAAWAQFYATRGQLETMNRQLDEVRDSGKDTSDQATRIINNMNWLAKEMHYSVKEAQIGIAGSDRQSRQSLETATNSAHLDERSWITASKAVLKGQLAIGEKVIVEIEFSNSGKTPALDVEVIANALSSPDISEIHPAMHIGKDHLSKGTLAPTVPMLVEAGSDSPIRTQTQIDAIRYSATSLYAYGTIFYRDIFRQHHRTIFCFVTDGTRMRDGQFIFAACPKWNNAN